MDMPENDRYEGYHRSLLSLFPSSHAMLKYVINDMQTEKHRMSAIVELFKLSSRDTHQTHQTSQLQQHEQHHQV